jgi:Rad52/22 family double-strand break repair protein.
VSKTPAEITAKLVESFPHDVIEDKQGKRYIAAEHIIWRLIEATGNNYEWRIDAHEYRNDGTLRDRTDRKTGETIPAPPVCVVHGTLTIPGLGSRSDSGVQEMEAGQGADAAYKGAVSDCLKRCARLFGVGLRQLYMGEDVPAHLQAPKERAASRAQSRPSTRVDATEAAVRNLTETPRENPEYKRPEPNPSLASQVRNGRTDTEDPKRAAFKSQAEKAFADGSTEAIEKICDSADSPGKWVMLATLAPNLTAIEAIGLAAVDRGAYSPHLDTAITKRKAELESAAQ